MKFFLTKEIFKNRNAFLWQRINLKDKRLVVVADVAEEGNAQQAEKEERPQKR